MKYASQINILLLIVAVVTFGYAISETLLRSPVVPLVEALPSEAGGTSDPESDTLQGAESESVARENLRRPSQLRRPTTGPSRESTSEAALPQSPSGSSPSQPWLPPWNPNAAGEEETGARVISTGASPSGQESESDPEPAATPATPARSDPRARSRTRTSSSPPERARFARPAPASGQDSGNSGDRGARRQAPPPPPTRSSNR